MFDVSLFIIGQSHPKLKNKLKSKFKKVYQYNHLELFHNEISKKNHSELSDCIFLPDLNFFQEFLNEKGELQTENLFKEIDKLLIFFENVIFSPILNYDFLNKHPLYSWDNIFLEINSIIKKYRNNENFIYIEEVKEDILERAKLRSILMFNSKVSNGHLEHIFSTVIRANYQKIEPVKLIIVDADNTLWGGIASEDSFEDITLGSHSLEGELFILFQKQLLALKERGFLLAICSKSNIHSTLKIINKYPECFLKEDHFVSIKCSWSPKSENIKAIISELNLRTSSALFIDDSYHEIDEVKSNLPSIKTLFLSEDIFSRPKQLRDSIFTTGEFPSEESKNRTKSYKENERRLLDKEKLFDAGNNYEKWLKSLKTLVTSSLSINPLENKRIKQLSIRSRQFNTNPKLIKDIKKLANSQAYTFNLKDKHGSLGLIGIAIFKIEKNIFEIQQIILSCRSFSRDVEKLMIYFMLRKWEASKLEFIKFLLDPEIENDNYGKKFMLNNKIKTNHLLTKKEIPDHLFRIPNYLSLKDE
tara:strand:+ start:2180 stop:3772 length:1593 start_codon:yes stop_codon:yes gene_type:complete